MGHSKKKDSFIVSCEWNTFLSIFVIFIIVISFASLALEGAHTQKARPVEVLTHSQGNLEAKGNLEQPIQVIVHFIRAYTYSIITCQQND